MAAFAARAEGGPPTAAIKATSAFIEQLARPACGPAGVDQNSPGGRCIGFAMNVGLKGWLPVDIDGHDVGNPLPSVAEAATALHALARHMPADGDSEGWPFDRLRHALPSLFRG